MLKKGKLSVFPSSLAWEFEGEGLQSGTDTDLEPFADHGVKADPGSDEWDDLDAEDTGDPLMVSEYIAEIFSYMKSIKVSFTTILSSLHVSYCYQQVIMPNPSYIDTQNKLTWTIHSNLIHWIIQVHLDFHLLPETLFLAINIIDCFLSACTISLAKLQLVGITCLFIASKVEEIVSPSITHFLNCIDLSYMENKILQGERYMLNTLEWNLSYPNPIHFLQRLSNADKYDAKARIIAKYLADITCLEWRLLSAPPSLLAATAIWLLHLILDNKTWVCLHFVQIIHVFT